MPPIVVNINAYKETVIEWTSLLIFLVTKSLNAKHATPNKTIKEEVREKKVVEYESETIEMYEMISSLFDFEELRLESPHFNIK